MEHRVKFVNDDMLIVAGEQVEWALCNARADGVTLCIRRGLRSMPDEYVEDVLAAAWEGYRQLREERPELRVV